MGVLKILKKGGGVSKNIVVLASEPVGGRSRATELPCFHINDENHFTIVATVKPFSRDTSICQSKCPHMTDVPSAQNL